MVSALISTPRFPALLSTALGKVLWRNVLWRFTFFSVREEAILEQDENGEWNIAVVL